MATMIEHATQSAREYTPGDDLALVRATRGGDVAAFEQLVQRYDNRLLRIAHNITRNLEDAEEAVQEAFVKAYQKLDQFQGHAKFSTWLVRITLNESFMKVRKERSSLKQSIDCSILGATDGEVLSFDLQDWAPNPEALYRASELHEILTKCLQRLTPALKIVFVLCDIEEYSASETSQILNLTLTAVKTRLSRARLQLRKELTKVLQET